MYCATTQWPQAAVLLHCLSQLAGGAMEVPEALFTQSR